MAGEGSSRLGGDEREEDQVAKRVAAEQKERDMLQKTCQTCAAIRRKSLKWK